MRQLTDWEKVQLARTPIETPDDLWNVFAGLFNLRFPRTKVCEHCDAPFDAIEHAFFARNPMDIWIGNRGGGKTLALSALVSMELINLQVNCNIIGGSKDQAEQIIKYIRQEDTSIKNKLWGAPNAPVGLLNKSDTRSRFTTVDGYEALALASAPTAVRSKHPVRLRFDEVDVAKWSVVEDSYGLTKDDLDEHGNVRVKAHSVFSSTYHVPRGSMWALLQRAKREGLRVFRWCWRELMVSNGGWWTEDFIARKRKEVTPERWAIEFDNVEPMGGHRIWTPEQVDRNIYPELGRMPGDPNTWYRAFKGCPPRGKRRYYTGIDWAAKQDDTVITTLTDQDSAAQLVAWYRTGKTDWDVVLNTSAEHIAEYHPGGVIHDSTTYGQTMHDFLKNHALVKELVRRKKLQLDGMNFTGRLRINEIATLLQKAIEDGEMILPAIEFLRETLIYMTDDMLRGHQHMPDTFVSLMLAYASYRKHRKSGLYLPPQMLVIKNE